MTGGVVGRKWEGLGGAGAPPWNTGCVYILGSYNIKWERHNIGMGAPRRAALRVWDA